MGANGKEISCERFPKNPEKQKTKSAKQTIQTKIRMRRKFNLRTIIPGKKFLKIWMHLTRLSLRVFHSTQISEIMVRKFPEKSSRLNDLNLEIIEKFQANKAVRLVVFHTGIVSAIRPWKFPEIHTGISIWSNGKRPLNFGKCSSIRQCEFAEIQTRIFYRIESAIDFSLYGACFLNCYTHYHLVILISI